MQLWNICSSETPTRQMLRLQELKMMSRQVVAMMALELNPTRRDQGSACSPTQEMDNSEPLFE